MKRRVLGENRMAYVLVALGASMAAVGVYTVGYSVLNARFDEYWTALGAGATLMAGGMVTLALGFTIRSLTQLKATLSVQPAAAPALDTASSTMEMPAAPGRIDQEPSLETPALIAPVEQAALVQAPPIPAPPAPIPHPLRPPPPVQEPAGAAPLVATKPDLFDPPPNDHGALHERETDGHVHVPETHDVGPASPFAEPALDPAVDRHAVEAARPADDYKLETPSTAEHDLPGLEGTRTQIVPPPLPPPEPAPDDWLDRAFADLDEELPVGRSSDRHSPSAVVTPQQPPARPEIPAMEPVLAEPEPARAAPREPATLPPMPQTPEPAKPPPQVIGRYESEGTSYVMYADGSIEAQSSSGVYRFASMAELKAFIES